MYTLGGLKYADCLFGLIYSNIVLIIGLIGLPCGWYLENRRSESLWILSHCYSSLYFSVHVIFYLNIINGWLQWTSKVTGGLYSKNPTLASPNTEETYMFANKTLMVLQYYDFLTLRHDSHVQKVFINPFRPEFTIVIFIHYKPRIACSGWRWLKVGGKLKKIAMYW